MIDNDTLNLTRHQQRGNDAALLAYFALFIVPVPLWRVFAFSETNDPPRWAVEACARLLAAGKLRDVGDGLLEVVDATGAPIISAVPGVQLHRDHIEGEARAVKRGAMREQFAAA